MKKIPLILLLISLLYAPLSLAQDLQDSAQVVEVVEDFLHNHASSSYPGSVTIRTHSPAIRNQAACEQLQAYLPSGARLRPSITVNVRCQAPETWNLRVKAEIAIDGYYYTANRTLDMGQTITLDDLNPIEGDLLRLPANAVTDPSHIVGHTTKQRIHAGNTIRTSQLRDPNSIERGQTVRTLAQGVGFTATGEGTALQNGSPGSQIQVRVSSGKIIQGTVLDAQTVLVF